MHSMRSMHSLLGRIVEDNTRNCSRKIRVTPSVAPSRAPYCLVIGVPRLLCFSKSVGGCGGAHCGVGDCNRSPMLKREEISSEFYLRVVRKIF